MDNKCFSLVNELSCVRGAGVWTKKAMNSTKSEWWEIKPWIKYWKKVTEETERPAWKFLHYLEDFENMSGLSSFMIIRDISRLSRKKVSENRTNSSKNVCRIELAAAKSVGWSVKQAVMKPFERMKTLPERFQTREQSKLFWNFLGRRVACEKTWDQLVTVVALVSFRKPSALLKKGESDSRVSNMEVVRA